MNDLLLEKVNISVSVHFWCPGVPKPTDPPDRLIWPNSVSLCNTGLDVIIVVKHNLPNPDVPSALVFSAPPHLFSDLLFLVDLFVMMWPLNHFQL